MNEIAHKLYPPATQDQVEQAEGRFLVVRHPFYRLVSAYRDKLERVLLKSRDGDYFLK